MSEKDPSLKVPSNDLITLTDLVLKNNILTHDNVKKKTSTPATGSNFVLENAYIYIDQTELKYHLLIPFILLWYINSIFLFRHTGKI